MDKNGEPIAFGEYFKWITENEKTQIVFFQDVQALTRRKPRHSEYVQKDGFNNIYIHFKTDEQKSKSTAPSRVHFHHESDIKDTISPAFERLVD